MKICQYFCLHMKIICWIFHIKTPFTFRDMHMWVIWKVSQAIKYIDYFLRNLRTSQATFWDMHMWVIWKVSQTKKYIDYFLRNLQTSRAIFWDMHMWVIWKVSQTIKCIAYLLRNLQTSWASNSRTLRIKNAKFWECYFYMKTNI